MSTGSIDVVDNSEGLDIEFQVDDGIDQPTKFRFTILSGGRAQVTKSSITQEVLNMGLGVGEPFYGAIGDSMLKYTFPLEQKIQPGCIRGDYHVFKLKLMKIKNIALTLREKDWGTHEIDVLEYYKAIKQQSDELLEVSAKHHPEFEQYRIPDIILAIEKAVREALGSILG